MEKDIILGAVSFMCCGVKFDTLEEYIAIMKNDPNQTRGRWLNDLNILMIDHEPHIQKNIQKMTEDEVMDLVDKTPAITREEAEAKYTSNQLKIILYIINTPFEEEDLVESLSKGIKEDLTETPEVLLVDSNLKDKIKTKIILTINNGFNTEKFNVATFKRRGDAVIALNALQNTAPEHFKYSLR